MTGHDVFIGISQGLDARGPFSALFVGSTEATLAAVATRYRRDYANASVHVHSPPFRAVFDAEDVAAIESVVKRHRPDLLWLGLTAPKQELLLDRLQASTDFGVGASIGAVFDFYVGNVKRSPKVFQRLGLEWLPRLVQQPRRLWRRTFVSAPIFIVDLLRARIGLGHRNAAKP